MGRGRPAQKERCIFDKPIGRDHWTAANTGVQGTKLVCTVCEAGPLHPGPCGCSFRRRGFLVCRDCAVAYDIVQYGKSKISNDVGELDPITINTIRKGYTVVHFQRPDVTDNERALQARDMFYL